MTCLEGGKEDLEIISEICGRIRITEESYDSPTLLRT